jgi:hypothetical protein
MKLRILAALIGFGVVATFCALISICSSTISGSLVVGGFCGGTVAVCIAVLAYDWLKRRA